MERTSPGAATPSVGSQRLDPLRPVDLDRRTWLKLRRGLYPIEARLDLHGLSQAQAHERLTAFLALAQQRGNRCVLLITGRGVRHGGTLRAMVPRWLDEPPNRLRVLAYAEAHLRHGGEGALYVLLRRASRN
jgi:DNA-nicking Smr family endonuclease